MSDEQVERKPYKLLRGSHGRWEDGVSVVYTSRGENSRILLTDEEAKSKTLANRITPLSDSDVGTIDEWSFLSEQNVSTVSELISGMDNIGQLKSLKQAEIAGLNRKMVMRAVDDRLEKLGATEE